MLISESYRALQRDLHDNPRGYGGKGDRWADLVETLIKEFAAAWTLDYGAGRGTLGREIQGRGYNIENYDPAIAGWEQMPSACDLVVCTDVLEHVEPDCLAAVLAHIASCTKTAALIVIGLEPANKTLPDGRNAHLILQPVTWWRAELARHFEFERPIAGRDKEFAAVWRPKP